MKRPIKPFVVEVRKGAKAKAPAQTKTVLQENKAIAHQLAERKLFSTTPAKATGQKPAGRILQSLETPAPAPLLLEEPARRRGRPPGSRNKPKAEAASPAIPRKRGRPRKIPEGQVRHVPVTPDLASAVLARLSDPPPAPGESVLGSAPAPAPVPKAFAALDQLLAAAQSGEPLQRERAGERWKRRLRGAARQAFERRHAKV